MGAQIFLPRLGPRITEDKGIRLSTLNEHDREPLRRSDEAEAAEPTLPGRIVRHLRRNVPLVVLDVAVVATAYLGPLVLRFDGDVPNLFWLNFWFFLPFVAFVHLMANYMFGLYGQMWRYASVQEARQVILAGATAGVIVILLSGLFGGGLRLLPLSVAMLGATLSLIGFGAIRFQNRLFAFRRRTAVGEPSRILLVGAGDAGEMVLRDILRNDSVGLIPVGIIDDDPRKRGLVLHGVTILGRRAQIPSLVKSLRVDQVLLAIPSATGELVRQVAGLCEEADVTLRVLPSVRQVVGGRVSARDIRDLRIEDLLGRAQVETDLEAVGSILRGRRVLVLGAGGSIGSEIARQVAQFEPSSLILLDHDETHLFEVLSNLDGTAPMKAALVDIRDRDRVFSTFLRHQPEVVFHAAAHKHVPLLEEHPEEALYTNVIGTANVADAALATGVKRFVLISTDKAVRPTTAMGSSKWFAEQVVRSLDGGDCVFCAVRFGNVLGSRGSVIPTFFRQILKGGPVTVTDSGMARYFMSLDEAVQLVLQAAALSEGGEVFTLDMGEPVNILTLAQKMIRLSGRVPGRDVPITIVGIRPGEKLVEDVVDPDELPGRSSHPSIIVSHPASPDRGALRRAIREMESLAGMGLGDELSERMKQMTEQPLHATTEGAS
jgi:FlaA1/EpsC-like NDP-sugar epimerase